MSVDKMYDYLSEFVVICIVKQIAFVSEFSKGYCV